MRRSFQSLETNEGDDFQKKLDPKFGASKIWKSRLHKPHEYRNIPWEGRCMEEALYYYVILAKVGIDSEGHLLLREMKRCCRCVTHSSFTIVATCDCGERIAPRFPFWADFIPR